MYWHVLINRLLLDLNTRALKYGTIKSHKYSDAIYNMPNKNKTSLTDRKAMKVH